MKPRLTIVKKGLLFLITPLLLQAVFIGILVRTQVEVDRAQKWAVHTKEVMALVENIYRGLLETYAGIRIPVVSENPSGGRPRGDSLERLPHQLRELRYLVSDNSDQMTRLDLIARQSEALRTWLVDEKRLIRSGEGPQAIERLNKGVALLGAVRTTIDAMLVDEDRLDRSRTDRMNRSTRVQTRIVIGGGLAFLGTAMALALLFLNGVIKRLGVLEANVRRVAEGNRLVPPVTGSDEIARVDRAFHDLTTNLDRQKEENEMFVYSVSHDLRSPLINLQGFSEELELSIRELQLLFQHEGMPQTVRNEGLQLMQGSIEDSIHYIQNSVGRLARIIDALLRLSRTGRIEYQWQTLDLQTIVRKVVDSLHDTIVEKQAKVIVRTLPAVHGDATAVEQIFANLIGNAVLYLDQSRAGMIEVGSRELLPSEAKPRQRVYYVKDNGLGIPKAYHQRVFTAFSRLHADVAQGEGIGLAWVRRMVERHGGKVWLESESGLGSTFFVALPAAAAAPGQDPPETRKAPLQRNPQAEVTTHGTRSDPYCPL